MEQQPRLPLWFLVANWALILAAFALGITLGGQRKADLPQPQGTALELVYNEILHNHVEAQDGQVLLDRAIGAMAGQLDEYSEYVPPSLVRRYDEATTGQYDGVGMRQVLHGDEMVVYYPFAGSPAERAGVQPGDRLVAVDGQRLADLPRDTRETRTVELVRGAAGTEVRLQLLRNTEAIELAVRRGPVQPPSVKWVHFLDEAQGLGYLYVADFHHGVTQEVLDAIAQLNRQAPLRGLVLDLRFDGGGSLEECVAMARTFQPTGTIVSTRRRNQVLEMHTAKPELCLYGELPMVVLVNEFSASASEVLAGCLQDHGRAALVGVRTYGKGVVNTVYSWKEFRLKLTTAHYFTPNGRNIEGHSLATTKNADANGNRNGSTATPAKGGIEPDVVVPTTKEQRDATSRLLRDFEPPAAHREAFTALAAKLAVTAPSPPQVATDPQLDKALLTLVARIATPRKNGAEGAKSK